MAGLLDDLLYAVEQLCDHAILAQGSLATVSFFLILGPGIAMSGVEPWHVREHDRGGDPWHRREDRDLNGRRGVRSNYSAVHDPTNRVLPEWISQVGDNIEGEFVTGGSCLIVDNRDKRLVSPLQGLFPIEIHDNV